MQLLKQEFCITRSKAEMVVVLTREEATTKYRDDGWESSGPGTPKKRKRLSISTGTASIVVDPFGLLTANLNHNESDFE